MHKMVLKTIDKDSVYSFKKATIFTVNYTRRIFPSEIHTPNAAKIIIEDDSIISSFIILQPLINSLDNGDILVHTDSTFNQATLKEKYDSGSHNIKSAKRAFKLLRAKFELGISIQELIDLNLSSSNLEALILEKRKEKLNKGGGF